MAQKLQMEITATVHTQSLSLLPRNAQLVGFILKFRSADGSESNVELALLEALTNAAIHGNSENSGKRVYVTCRCYMDGEVSIMVRDEGTGFDSRAVLDPTLRENLLFTHGRGIYLMKTLMDEVSFEEGDSVVRMRKVSNSGAGSQEGMRRFSRGGTESKP